MKYLLIVLAVLTSVPLTQAFDYSTHAKGVILLSCGECDKVLVYGYYGNYYAYRRECSAIGWKGHHEEESNACDPDGPKICGNLDISLTNKVSRGQMKCDAAREQYAHEGCGELGWPNCDLFDN
jgi:hypothetical protein